MHAAAKKLIDEATKLRRQRRRREWKNVQERLAGSKAWTAPGSAPLVDYKAQDTSRVRVDKEQFE